MATGNGNGNGNGGTPSFSNDPLLLPSPWQREQPDRFIPEQVVADILAGLPTASVVRSLARTIPLSSRAVRMVLPGDIAEAHWVQAIGEGQPSDTGLKKVTKFGFRDMDFVVEELAAIVVIPNAYVDDANIDLWAYARGELTAAFARKLDQAFLFGIDRPATTGDSVWEIADAAGNVFGGANLVDAVLEALSTLPNVTNMVSQRQFPYMVAAQNQSALWFNPTGAAAVNLFGIPTTAPLPGAWDSSKALALLGNWNNAILGIRQDITFQMFDQGVLTDDSGNIQVNLMQQDSQALRSVMRVAWAVRPEQDINLDGERVDIAPFGAIAPETTRSAAKQQPAKKAPAV